VNRQKVRVRKNAVNSIAASRARAEPFRGGGRSGAGRHRFLVRAVPRCAMIGRCMIDLATVERRATRLRGRGLVEALHGLGRGLEKESLRVLPDGRVSQASHPAALGAPLTHETITTDFSEALLEFHTPVHRSLDALLAELDCLHRFVVGALEGEGLWNASMPCILEGDGSIPIARYGSSNPATFKTVYRRGLSLRYGRPMQAISGLHYNLSLPESWWPVWADLLGATDAGADFVSGAYMGMLRNALRVHPLLVYLFGASPAICKSFARRPALALSEFDAHTWFGPEATSLRLSAIGYQNPAQAELRVSPNSLAEYAAGLERAVLTPWPPYEAIGLHRNGERVQLGAGVLQIENEYYGFVRPKQPVRTGERVVRALRARGVRYLEVRSLDVNPYSPIGVEREDLLALDALLLLALLAPSAPLDDAEAALLHAQHQHVALHGRGVAPAFPSARGARTFRDWASELLDGAAIAADLLDAAGPDGGHGAAVRVLRARVGEPEASTSGRILADMRREGCSYFRFAHAASLRHAEALRARPLTPAERAVRSGEVARSREALAALEAADAEPFEAYLQRYFA
jgi:glutamate--cysteine ligase